MGFNPKMSMKQNKFEANSKNFGCSQIMVTLRSASCFGWKDI